MSQPVIYFGAPIKNKKAVPPEIRSLNINLLPVAPSRVNIDVAVQVAQPGYSLYKNALPLYVKSAFEEVAVPTSTPIYYQPDHFHVPAFHWIPDIIWSYNYELSPDKITDIKTRFEAKETQTSHGKQAFIRKWKDQTWWNTLKAEVNVNRQTPSTSTTMNMNSFVHYVVILRTIDWFMRINQYSTFKTSSDKESFLAGNFGYSGLSDKAKSYSEWNDEGTMKENKDFVVIGSGSAKTKIYANLIHPFVTHQYVTHGALSIHQGHDGIVLPFIEPLADIDNAIFARVFSGPFIGFIGEDREDALETLNLMKASWGTICRTRGGKEISHILRCIELCLQTGTFLQFFENSSKRYEGSIMYGAGYTLQFNNTIIEPVGTTELIKAITSSSSHGISLDYIFSKLSYPDAGQRDAAKGAVKTLREVAVEIRTHPFSIGEERGIIEKAYFLSFHNDLEFLYPNSHNIAKVLKAIADDSVIETNFPLHPEAITSVDKTYRLLSAFGMDVPTFIVPGGKKMSLEGNFTVPDRDVKGDATVKDVHKIAVAFTDLKQAFIDFNTVKTSKEIQNPFGNKGLSNSNAYTNTGLLSRFEKDHAQDILVALREAVGAKPPTAGTAAGKRARETDNNAMDRKAKKSKLFDV